MPFIFAWHLQQAGIELTYDPELGVLDRRTKNAAELEALARAQAVTEEAMEMACRTVATARAAADGTLQHEGETLTSERLKARVAGFLSDRGFSLGHGAIVATAPHAADCHHAGTGPLKTGLPVIVDLYPRDDTSRYWGDCTRTVVHGSVPEIVQRMHQAVVEAKAAGIAKLQIGQTGEAVHQAVIGVQQRHGFRLSRGQLSDEPTIQHGTGHGIGLEVHEPILLHEAGGPILEHEVFTVEPGLYGRTTGGVRVEDMVVVTADGPRNLNRLPEGLDWS
jgi:Xaa-Pro aminopeptidase